MENRRAFLFRAIPRLLALATASQVRIFPAQAHSSATTLRNRLTDPKYSELLEELRKLHGFPRAALEDLFRQASIYSEIIDLFEKPSEDLPYSDYRELFISRFVKRLGREYLQRNRQLFDRVEETYGVDSHVIAAILGVESKFGRQPHAGFRVFDALNTVFSSLPRRESFGRRELIEFLLLCREENLKPLDIKGSYAGAMGLPQFIPSSYRMYAVDYDQDGRRDLWNSDSDIVASVANYLRRHGWRRGAPIRVILRADTQHPNLQRLMKQGIQGKTTLAALRDMGVNRSEGPGAESDQVVSVIASPWGDPEQIALLFPNFRAVLQYNRSINYALVVADLAEDLA